MKRLHLKKNVNQSLTHSITKSSICSCSEDSEDDNANDNDNDDAGNLIAFSVLFLTDFNFDL